MILSELEKRPEDQFGHAIFYQNVFQQGEFVSTCTVGAVKSSDGSNVAASMLVSTTGTIPRFTATGGSVSTAIFSSDVVALGFAVGDYVVNETKGFRARIVDIKYGSAKNDTVVFETQPIATAAADVVSAQKAIFKLKAGGGANGDRVKVSVTTTTNLSNTFLDEVFVNVRTV